MAIQIGAKPDSGFDDPIGMLVDCHRRIERFLLILCVVADRTGNGKLSDEEVAAVRAALSYFRVGGVRHTADEEESLFPRLRAEPSSATFEDLDRLERDHYNATDFHETVDKLFSAWIARDSLSLEDRKELQSSTANLKNLYEQHIKVEEKIVFPRAAETLDDQTIAAIGQEFQARRE